jgi:ABC-type multidrug transport system permease subunit
MKKKLSQKEVSEFNEAFSDFYAWVITQSIFYLIPYILIFVFLGFIFS